MLLPYQRLGFLFIFIIFSSFLAVGQSATLHYSTAGRIAKDSLTQIFSMVPEGSPSDITFSNDGSRMYVIGNSLDNAYEFLLGSAYDVSTASIFDTLDISAQEAGATGIAFNDLGDKMFIVGTVNDQVIEYDLSFPFYMFSAFPSGQSFSVTTEDGTPADIEFSPDGRTLFMLGNSSDQIFEYLLTIPYDINTASYSGNFMDVSAEETGPSSFTFNANGTRLFLAGTGSDRIYRYDLSTPYDILTASYTGVSNSVVSEDTSPQGIFLSPDGTRLYMVGSQNDNVYQYDLSSSAFIETAANDGGVIGELIFRLEGDFFTNPGGILTEGSDYSFTNLPPGLVPTIRVAEDSVTAVLILDVNATDHDDTDVESVEFFFSNSAFFFGDAASVQGAEGGVTNLAIDFTPDPIPEVIYSTSVDIATGNLGAIFNIASFDTAPTDVTFNNDGSKMYLVGSSLDSVFEFDLSPAFDLSSAVRVASLHVGFEETSASGITFNPTGSRMFLVGLGNDAVREYSLSLPFDLSSASITENILSVVSEDISSSDLAFNADGTTLFVLGNSNDAVFAYTLSVPYDIATGSYSGNSFSVADGSSTGLAFNANGSKMLITGASGDRIYQYDLGNEFDITSAVFSGISLDALSIDGSIDGIALSSDGTKAFIAGTSNDNIYEINLSTNAFYEAEANDGFVEGEMIIKVVGDSFTNPGVSLTNATDYSVSNLPVGLIPDIFVSTNSQTATLTVSGPASSHDEIDDITDLQFNFENSAFTEGIASSVINAAPGSSLLGLDFASNPIPELSYSTGVTISTGIFNTSFSVSGEDPTPTGIAFNTDGSKLFMVGQSNDQVHEYSLGTNYGISSASFVQSLDIGFEETSPSDITFNPSGTRMYIIGFGADAIFEYILTTEFDISTASFSGKSLSVASEDSSPQDIAFNNDGTKFFVLASSGNLVLEYITSTPYDISTSSYSGNSFSINDGEASPGGFTFNKDGTKLFVTGSSADRIFQYDLSTGFDINSAVISPISYSTAFLETSSESIALGKDGKSLFILGSGNDAIYSFDLLPHAFIENGANEGVVDGELIVTLQGDSFQNAGGSLIHTTDYNMTNLPSGLTPNLDVSSDGLTAKITLSGAALSNELLDDVIDVQVTFENTAFVGNDATAISNAIAGSSQLSISFADNPIPAISYAHPIDIGTAQLSSSFSINPQDVNPSGLSFNNDGSKMYMVGVSTDSVYEYSLSPNFDISSASYSGSYFVGFDETNPTGIAFNEVGTRMYVIGFDGDQVDEYLLELPFDLSTASLTGISLDISAEDTTPRDLVFSNDGLSLYTVGSGNDAVYHYSFSNPYDLSSGSFVSSLGTVAQETTPTGLAFNTTGTRLFITGQSSDRIFRYDLGTAYDLNSAIFSGVQISIANEDISPEAISFSNDGTKLFLLGSSSDNVHSYDLTSNAFRETAANDGALEGGMSIKLVGDQFSVSGGLLNAADFSVTNLPAGMTADIFVEASGTEATFLLNGQATAHSNLEDVLDILVTYQDAAFMSGAGAASISNATGTVTSGLGIDFAANAVPEISYAHPVNINTNVLNSSFSVNTEEAGPTGMTFNNDGSKVFITGNSGDHIVEYGLTLPYDLSSGVAVNASYSVVFEESVPTGLAFNNEGTRLFMIGQGSDMVHEYFLSNPFDISPGSISRTGKTFDISLEASAPSDVQFNNDGSRMYVLGNVTDSVYQYDLATNFDISSGIYLGAYYVGNEDGTPLSVSFNANGSQMLILGSANDRIYSYDLGVNFDVTTAIYNGEEIPVGPEDTTPEGMSISKDGSLLFIIGASSDSFYSYDLTKFAFTETAANSGEVEGEMLIRLNGDDFSISDGLLNAADFSVSNLPPGLSADIYVDPNGQSASLFINGQALSHVDVDDLLDIQITYQDGAFLSGTGASSTIANASGGVTSGLGINFTPNLLPEISYSHPIDINTAIFNSSFNVSADDGAPTGMVFNNDGTKVFMTGNSNDRLYEYALATPYDLGGGVTLTNSRSIALEETVPTGLTFNSNGTRLFMVGQASDLVHEYFLSNPFDISLGSISYTGKTIDMSTFDANPSDVQFNVDGSRMYVLGHATDSVYQFDLGFNYDLSTASYGGAFHVGMQDISPLSVAFNANGSQMLILGSSSDIIYSYHLTNSFDVTTAIYDGVEFSISAQEISPEGMALSKDGTQLFIAGANSDSFHSYDLTTNAFRETSANEGELEGEMIINLVGDQFSVSDGLLNAADFSVSNLPAGLAADIYVDTNGRTASLVISGQATAHDELDDVLDIQITYQDGAFLSGTGASSTIANASGAVTSGLGINFTANLLPEISYAHAIDINTTIFNSSFDVSADDGGPTGMTFNNDGTKVFMTGNSNDRLYEYALATPYDLGGGVTLTTSRSIALEETVPTGLTFNSNGTRLFMVGQASDLVHEYFLSNPFDISLGSISYTGKTIDMSTFDANPSDVQFNVDGSRMYVLGHATDSVYQFDLGLNYDLSTASYGGAFHVGMQDISPLSVAFNANGSQMLILGSSNDIIYSYHLPNYFDVTSAIYEGIEFSIGAQEISPEGMALSKDGTQLFITGANSDSFHSYDLTTNAFRETSANEGELEGEMIINLVGDQFSVSDGLLNAADFSVSNLPPGLTADIYVDPNGYTASLFISGQAIAHDNLDEVLDIQIIYQDGAFLSGTGASAAIANASGTVSSGLGIDFTSNLIPEISYAHPIDINANVFSASFDVSADDAGPSGLTFNNDGTKVFMTGNSNDRLYEYALGTPYDLSSGLTLTTSHPLLREETVPTGLSFSNDGARLFVVGQSSDRVHEYFLTNPFDISAGSISYTGKSLDVSAFDSTPSDVQFNVDGSRMFVLGNTTDSVYQFDLGFNYDISTATYGGAFRVGAQDFTPLSIAFNANGSQMLLLGSSTDAIYSYHLSSLFDVTTASYTDVLFSVASQELTAEGMALSKDGTQLFITGANSDSFHSYDLTSDAFIETAANNGELSGEMLITLVGDEFSVSDGLLNAADFSVSNLPAGLSADIYVDPNGQTASLFLIGQATAHDDLDDVLDIQVVYQDGAFLSGAGSSVAIANASGTVTSGLGIDFTTNPLPEVVYSANTIISKAELVGSIDVSAEESNPSSVAFNHDGSKMYLVGTSSDNVNEYNLSVPYDVTTATLSTSFDLSLNEGSPSGIVFNTSGSRMFVSGLLDDEIDEYILTTPFDISTAYYSSISLDISTEDSNAQGLAFSSNGLKMFIVGTTTDAIYEYDLAIPFDLSTATASGNSLSVSPETSSPSGITFSLDGYTLLVVSLDEEIFQYHLTAPFDITTAFYSSIELDISSEDITPQGVVFSRDGTQLYMVGASTDQVYQYSLGNSTFIESAENNGGVTGLMNINLFGDTFSSSGSSLTDGVDYSIDNLPAGLIPDIQVDPSGSQATLFLSGNSTSNVDIDDVVNLQITFQDAAFVNTSAASILNATAGNTGLAIDFTQNPIPALIYGSDGDISSMNFTGQFSVASEEVNATDLAFSNDGSKAYIAGSSTDYIYEYDLSVNFDISTANLVDSLHLDPVEGIVSGIAFNSSGTRVFTVGSSSAEVKEFALSIPYVISSAFYTGESFSFGTEDTFITDVDFSADGTKMYAVGNISNAIHQYDLTVPFDITSSLYSGVSLLVSDESTTPAGIDFNANGSKMVLIESGTDDVYQYDLASNYDIGTASYSGISFSVNTEDTFPEGVYYENGGAKLFIIGRSSANILEYSLTQNQFVEGVANDGSVEGEIIISATGATFTNEGSVLTEGGDFVISNLPIGLTPNMEVTSGGQSATLSFSDFAIDNNDSDDVADLQFTFNNSSFTSGNAGGVTNATATNSGFRIDFSLNPDLIISTVSLTNADVIQSEEDVLIYKFNLLC